MSIRITGLQQVQDALKKELDKLGGGKFALIGIHESAGMVESGEFSMATLGALQHFGNDKIPARPWLDVGVEQGNKEYLDVIEEGIAEGLSQDQILEQVGAVAAGYAQQYITDLDSPPNAPSTIRKKAGIKGSKALKKLDSGASAQEMQAAAGTTPLIDTGAMRASVTYIVTNKAPEEGL